MPRVVHSSHSQPQYPSWGNNTSLERWEARYEHDTSYDNTAALEADLRTVRSIYESDIRVAPPLEPEWRSYEIETPAVKSPVQPSWAKIRGANLNVVKTYKSAIKVKYRIRNWISGVFTSDPITLTIGGGNRAVGHKTAYIVRLHRYSVDHDWVEQGLGWQTKYELSESFSVVEEVTLSTPIYQTLSETSILASRAGIPASHNDAVSHKSKIALTAVTSDSQQALYDLATSLAEAPSSLKTLMSTVTGCTSGVLRYKRALEKVPQRFVGKGGAKRLSKEAKALSSEARKHVSEAWLAYRYGIMPIIYDAQSLSKALKNVYNVEKGFSSESVDTSNSNTLGLYTGTTTRKTSIRAFYRGIYNSGGKRVQMHLPTTFVELVPYSVVVNWFANIKNYVGSMRQIPGANIVYGLTVKEDHKASVERQANEEYITHGGYSGKVIYFGGPVYSEEWKSMERSDAEPTSYLGVDVNMSSWRIVDAIAISLSRFF